MGAVFAMQGIGQFTAAMICLIVTAGFKESLLLGSAPATCTGDCALAVDKMWRVIIGFGAVPGCIALYFRLTIPETPRYTFDVARDVEKADQDTKAYMAGKSEGKPDIMTQAAAVQHAEGTLEIPKASWGDFMRHYMQWKHGKVLIGTAGSWFFLDVSSSVLSFRNTNDQRTNQSRSLSTASVSITQLSFLPLATRKVTACTRSSTTRLWVI